MKVYHVPSSIRNLSKNDLIIMVMELLDKADELEVYKKALDYLAIRCEALDKIANTSDSVCFKAKRWKEMALKEAREDYDS